MKIQYRLLLCVAALTVTQALGQEQAPSPALPAAGRASGPPPGNNFQRRLDEVVRDASRGQPGSAKPEMAKFNLDFPGGTPRQLVAAIEHATGRPLNAIIPDDLADTPIPALRMNNVDVSQLFNALSSATRRSEARGNGSGSSYSVYNTYVAFRTEGAANDDSIWWFYVEKPVTPPPADAAKACRFYSLAPYLDDGMKVEDITTAIQTGWKMLGESSTPAISFHKDTKLLIAVGDPRKLSMIDDVLKALDKQLLTNPNDPLGVYGLGLIPQKNGSHGTGSENSTPANKK